MKRNVLGIVVLLVFEILLPMGLWAQTPLFFDEIGASPRAIALGQAFTAVADDPSAAYYNPAGLTQTPSHYVLAMGYQYVKPMISIDVRDKNGNPYVQDPLLSQRSYSRTEDVSTRGMWTGIANNFQNISVFNNPPSFWRNLAFGLVMFNSLPENNQFWNPQRKQDPYHLRYNTGFCLLSMAFALGYRVTDYFSVGAGVLPRVDTFQNSADSYVLLDKMLNPDPDSGIRINMKLQTKVYAEWVIGVLFKPPFWGLEKIFSIGVAYRRELSGYYGTGRTDAPIAIVDKQGKVRIIFPLIAYTVDYVGYNPPEVSLGLAVKPFAGVMVSTDLTWKNYSEFKFFWALPPDPRLEDTWIPRIGLEYFFNPGIKIKYLDKIDKIRFLGGYYYEPSPVPDMNGSMNILDSYMNVVSVGIGLDYLLKGLKSVNIQTYFQIHLAKERVLTNEDDPLFGVIKTGGEVYSAGISISILL